jgi:predicted dehydrogenase
MAKRLRLGFIGCGSFAHRHAQNLQLLADEVEMVAFCNRTIDKAVALSQQYGVGQAAVFADHRQMFSQAPLDAVIITLPPYAHSDEVQMAAARGIHVFIEKPIALHSEDGWRMVEAAEKAGITTQVGFMLRFGEGVETLKSLIDDGTAGPVGLMAGRYFCNSLHAPWWRERQKSGGQLVEQVIHLVDLMRFLMGDAATVYSAQENVFHRDRPDYTVEDVSVTVYRFPAGGAGVIYASNGAIPNRWVSDFQLVAQNITAEFTSANHGSLHFTNDPGRPPLTISSERNVYLAEMQDFVQAINSGTQARTPLREGAKSLDMALAATRSAVERAELPGR